MNDCLFCAILAGDIPAEVVFETESVLAFRDLTPQAPCHVLVIPRVHAANIGELASSDPGMAGELLAAAAKVAALEGYDDFRLVFNTGADAGQSVFHVHGHVLAGRTLTWPPG